MSKSCMPIARPMEIPLLTIIPKKLMRQHPMTLRLYRIVPFRRYGQVTLAMSAGVMLQNAMRPLGVEAGTRSRAAERIIT